MTINEDHGVALSIDERLELSAFQRVLDEMEKEGLIVSKIYPDGHLRQSLTDKGRRERPKLQVPAE